MMLVEKPMTIKESSGTPGEPHRVLKEVVAIAAQDIDAGVQLVAIVAERFGDVGEHRAIAAAEDELLKLGSGLLIKSGSAFDPHGQQTSSADLITSKVLYIHTDRLGVGVNEIQAAFANTRFTPIIRDDAYWAAHDESRPPELFICHDSADKDAFVRPFADALSRKLVKVWYDENSLRPGDSLVESMRALPERRASTPRAPASTRRSRCGTRISSTAYARAHGVSGW